MPTVKEALIIAAVALAAHIVVAYAQRKVMGVPFVGDYLPK